ncbi:MAG TPA: hypothetical protein VJ984_15355 [Xanthomonadales bacterium]|nr:hypothetical protein [Xanthomonadales bacterium]
MILRICCLTMILFSMPLKAVEVPKADWIEHLKSIIPTVFCSSEQYFRQCFDVTIEQCEEAMSSSARVCIANLEDQIPEMLVQPDDGTHWGNVIGQCIGASYDQVHKDQRSRDPSCVDPTNWQK